MGATNRSNCFELSCLTVQAIYNLTCSANRVTSYHVFVVYHHSAPTRLIELRLTMPIYLPMQCAYSDNRVMCYHALLFTNVVRLLG